LAHVERMC